jgi:hypothetical protein
MIRVHSVHLCCLLIPAMPDPATFTPLFSAEDELLNDNQGCEYLSKYQR